MEHSYTRDFRLLESSQTASTRTLMVHRPPQCPSCHTHPHDERIDLEESYNPPIPSYNEESARRAMQESEHVVTGVRNSVSDDEDWEEKVNKFGWSVQQFKLFDRVARLLDMDRLARLTNTEKQHEPVHRRTVIDKSVSRLRQALASVSWETRLTQWLHSLLLENLPRCYLAIYIDILQTLHAKLPMLVNKMVFCNPHNVSQELLGPVLKKPWEPIVAHKNRKLPGQPYIVVVPSVPQFSQPTARQQKWFGLFATMASVVPIQAPPMKGSIEKQSLQSLAENMVAVTRAKIQQVRDGAPNRSIILVGFDAGAALAIQIGLVETVSCVVCLGFSYNTFNGNRGAPDDHIVDITSPVMFVIGQNSARSSQEEIEMLRSRMVAQTSLVVVGSADECLRVSKAKRKIEGVTQSMVENMVADEIAEFATNCLLSPPRPKKTMPSEAVSNGPLSANSVDSSRPLAPRNEADSSMQRKRKNVTEPRGNVGKQARKPPGRPPKQTTDSPRTIPQPAQEALDAAIQSILPTTPTEQQVVASGKKSSPGTASDKRIKYEVHDSGAQIISAMASTPIMLPALNREAKHPLPCSCKAESSHVNVKLISNQLIQLKPNTGTTQKFYSLKSPSKPVVSVMANVQDSFSPPKFTILRPDEEVTPNAAADSGDEVSVKPEPGNDLSDTNIFDLPIVFADNDGFIDQSSPQQQKPDSRPASAAATTPGTNVTILGGSPTSAVGSVETLGTPVQAPRLVTLQSTIGGTSSAVGKPNKLVLINKGSLKPVDGSVTFPLGTKINLPLSVATTVPVSTIVSSGTGGIKYTKVLLTKPLTAGGTISSGVPKNLSELLSSGKVEFINSAGVKQTAVSGTPVTMQQGKYQPIIINTTGSGASQTHGTVADGGTIVTSSTGGSVPAIVGGNKILIKTSASCLSAGTLTTSLVGRNVTLKRLNIVSSSPAIKPSPVVLKSEDATKEK